MNDHAHTILVVEDEDGLRTIIKTILGEAGYDVLLAENGAEGLALARSAVPDLILCDIQMPVMNGYELLNAVKLEPELVKIPFVFMTGVNTGRYDLRRGMDLGADDYLNKPFAEEDLISAVQTRLMKKQSWQKFFDSKIEKIHTGIIFLLPNELHMLVMDILEHSQFLLTEKNIPADALQRTAQSINASGKRLGHLHENILLFVMLQLWVNDQQKIASLRQETTESYLAVLTSVVEENPRTAERKGAVTMNCRDAGIRISPAYFGKVADELLDNACKFSDKGSPVTISSKVTPGELILTISDRGRGMSQEEIENIGSILRYEDRANGTQGTGLGLTIARTIAEIHGGRCTVKSEKNVGTTVTLTFPTI